MPCTRIIVGPFSRTTFREGLVASLMQQSAFDVACIEEVSLETALEDVNTPLVLLIDSAFPGIELGALPQRETLIVLAIGSEGQYADIRLHALSAARIVDAIRSLAGAADTLRSTVRPSARHLPARLAQWIGQSAWRWSFGHGFGAAHATPFPA